MRKMLLHKRFAPVGALAIAALLAAAIAGVLSDSGGEPGPHDEAAQSRPDNGAGQHNTVREDQAMPITVTFKETGEAFANPLKGFRPGRYLPETAFHFHEYGTVYKHYIKYTDLETTADDTAQKIKDWSNEAWAGAEEKNIKVVPRVVIVYPGSGEFWPEGVPVGDDPRANWTSAELKERLVAFIAKMGEAWDDDPRVAYIEASLWGDWGEHHIHPIRLADGTSYIPYDFQVAIGDAYRQAFQNKKVLIRYPFTFTDYEFGFAWDSFAHASDLANGRGIIERDVWRTQIIAGEPAYNWGDYLTQPGADPDTSLREDVHRDHIIDWIRSTHASGLSWIDRYYPLSAKVAEGAAEMQKAFGYRFVVDRATFPESVAPGGRFDVSLEIVNVGSAPFYYDWPVEASLLRSDRSVAWTGLFDADIRTWMPGDDWDAEARTYRSPAPVNRVNGSFTLPENIEAGTYTLALSILDPAGLRPSVRFAIDNYYKGGRHPIGKVGVGEKPQDQDLGEFDGLKFDTTLSYALE